LSRFLVLLSNGSVVLVLGCMFICSAMKRVIFAFFFKKKKLPKVKNMSTDEENKGIKTSNMSVLNVWNQIGLQ
jgi:hypothetical protein